LAETDTPLAWEARARILAGQSDEGVAARCRLAPETVHWFEARHFRVRDRLDAADWVAARVIGPGLCPTSGGRCRLSTDKDVLRQKALLAVGTVRMPADAPLRQLAHLYGRTRRREARPEPSKRAEKLIDRLAADGLRTMPAPRQRRPAAMACPQGIR
jgi:hypothetical protein